MDRKNYQALSDALVIYIDSMRSFVKEHLSATFSKSWWESGVKKKLNPNELRGLERDMKQHPGKEEIEYIEPDILVTIITKNFNDVFTNTFPNFKETRTYLDKVAQARNKWAHWLSPLDMNLDDVDVALYHIEHLLEWANLLEAKVKVAILRKAIRETEVNSEEHSFMDEALAYVYIAQFVKEDGPKRAGVLAEDCGNYHSQIEELVLRDEVQKKSWVRLSGYVTTQRGTQKAKSIISNRLFSHSASLNSELEKMPQRILQYIIQNILLANRDSFEFKPSSLKETDVPFYCLLTNKDILEVRDRLFQVLMNMKLMVMARDYVSTRTGEIREYMYVQAPELKPFFRDYQEKSNLIKDLWTQDLEEMHQVFHTLEGIHDLTELNRSIPVAYRESVNNFVTECLTDKIIVEATDNTGKHHIRIDDRLKYDTERVRRYQEPLIDFILGREQPEKPRRIKIEEPRPDSRRSTEERISAPDEGRLEILLGIIASQDVYWIPADEPNWNFAIVGGSGTGKSQTVKAILGEFARAHVPYIVFDFKDDYVPAGSTISRFGSVFDLERMSINPLELDGDNSPKDQKYQVSDIIDLVYTVGDLQVSYIRDAIKMSYTDRGIDEEDNTTWAEKPPTFEDLQRNLQCLADKGTAPVKNAINGIFARLDPIFDYRVFSAKTEVPFGELMAGQTIVHLGQLKNDALKAVVVEFLLRKLRYYLYMLPDSRDPQIFVVIDEAHRLKYDREASAGRLLKEARSKGVGLLLATQDPVDFTDVVYNNIGGILSLCLPDPPYAKKVAEHLGGKVTWQDIKNKLSGKFSAFVKFSSHTDVIQLRVTPHFEREG